MKSNVSLLAMVFLACAGKAEPPGHGDTSSGGRHLEGGTAGSSGKSGAGGASAREAGGSGGMGPASGGVSSGGAPAGGGVSSGGAPAGGATSTAGTDASGGKPEGGRAPVATGGSTLGGGAGTPAEGGSSGTSEGGAGAAGDAGAPGTDPISAAGRPCDIYAFAMTPCAAAYSTVRALFEAYDGPLYQVRRADGETEDIAVLVAGGFADAAAQDAFCGPEVCTISVVYDQSSQGNHLTKAPPDCYLGTMNEPSNESDAKGRALEVGGHDVYALHMIARDGYRANDTTGMPKGDEAQGIYEVVDGKRVGKACCWDFGNGSINSCPYPGASNALFFGTGYWGKGDGDGPWFMADFQPGVWAGGNGASNAENAALPSSTFDYAFGVLKTGSASYTLRVGNAQAGKLTTGYDGAAPHTFEMQGAVVLGIASDASDSSYGTFFEGAITKGKPSNAVDDAVLKNVQAAGYGK